MSSRQNKHTTVALFLLILTAFPAVVAGQVSEDDLASAREEFTELWHSAAATTKRRTALEQSLSTFDAKVATAKLDLEKAASQRKSIREQMVEHRALIDALAGQIATAQESRAFYTAIAESQREDFTRFFQYLSSRKLADDESGPSGGGPLLKRILRGSLGDTIDADLARDAALKARERFFGQLRVLRTEAERAEMQLSLALDDIKREFALLEKEHSAVSSIVTQKSQFIDDSWKVKKLTEAELAEVAQEAAESNARIAAMQASLVNINEDLKKGKAEILQKELVVLQQQLADAESARDAAKRKEEAVGVLEDKALKLFQQAIQSKYTDKKLYQRIETEQLKRDNAAAELALLTASGSTASQRDIDMLKANISFWDAALALMREGVTLEAAEAYVRARTQADQSASELPALKQRVAELSAEAAKISVLVSSKIAEIGEVDKYYALSDLPPIFLWPVNGPITAGFLDVAYVAVFGVPHRAVDIAVPQASPVRSVSDGIVFAVKDGGLRGYSYVLIGHRNGYASLYGHVSAAFVRNGDIVNAGQVIALSGGIPGTHGAGSMTTGAHVHLEITKDGSHVNPLSVLPSR